MTPAGVRPALRAGWPLALGRGFAAFVQVAVLGQLVALLVFLVSDVGVPPATFLRAGALYLGAFHRVPVTLEGDLDLGTLTGAARASPLPASGSATLTVGVALLGLTALAAWLLFRAGRRVAAAAGGRPWVRAVHGAKVALTYAAPMFLVALLVRIHEPVRLGSFVTGELRAELAAWPSLAFPFLIAAAAGAAGGLWSALGARQPLGRGAAALAGGWRMLVLGLSLSYAGLFAAGVVLPDEPVASTTPSTARYFRTVFGRVDPGLVVLAHHLAAAPNEAVWTLVPAMGGCDVVRGSVDAAFLCYGRFPRSVEVTLGPVPDLVPAVRFGTAPAGAYLFLLVPVLATVLGGRWAAGRAGAAGREGAAAGALAGCVFAVLVGVASVLSSVSLAYDAAFGAALGKGDLWIGPDPLAAVPLALVWGTLGGAAGALSTGRLRPRRPRRPGPAGAGTAPG